MQSIYGFRQAEVRAFLELAEEGIGEVRFEVQRLQNNFRSPQPLVVVDQHELLANHARDPTIARAAPLRFGRASARAAKSRGVGERRIPCA
jgi:ATP-dependent exoDNAse (exonuclease V) beta subunit